MSANVWRQRGLRDFFRGDPGGSGFTLTRRGHILATMLIVDCGIFTLPFVVTRWPAFDFVLTVIGSFTSVTIAVLIPYALLCLIERPLLRKAASPGGETDSLPDRGTRLCGVGCSDR